MFDEEKKAEEPDIKKDSQPVEPPKRPELRQLRESEPIQRPERPELRRVMLGTDKPEPVQVIIGKVTGPDKPGTADKNEKQPPKEKGGT